MFCQEALCATDPACTCQGNLTWAFDERKTGGHPVGVPGALAAAAKLLEVCYDCTLSQVGCRFYPRLLLGLMRAMCWHLRIMAPGP